MLYVRACAGEAGRKVSPRLCSAKDRQEQCVKQQRSVVERQACRDNHGTALCTRMTEQNPESTECHQEDPQVATPHCPPWSTQLAQLEELGGS